MELVAVTGATGQVGSRVARRLASTGAPMRQVVGVQYRDGEAMRGALDGATTLFLVSGRESADRVGEHLSAIDAAVAAGVERIVYLSFVGATPDTTFTFGRDHWHTEEYIRASGLRFTFLRDNFYQSSLAQFPGEDGVIRGPAGDGRVAAIGHDDIADVAVAVLGGHEDHDGATYNLTGPEALTLHEVAEELRRATGRPIRYQPETIEEAYASRAIYRAPDFEVAGWVTSYVAIAVGDLAAVTHDVQRVAGHRPQSFAEFLTSRK